MQHSAIKSIAVWDIPIRLFHWLLVVAIAYAWFSVEILEDMQQHFYAGYSILSLLIFRIIWGFIGSHYARFNSFIFSFRNTLDYAKQINSPTSPSHLGHNPLGALSIFAILAILLLQTGSGLFSNDDYFFGPLSGLIKADLSAKLTELHHLNFDAIKIIVIIHIVAIVFYRIRKNAKLSSAMITGRKAIEAADNGAFALASGETADSHESLAKSSLWLALVTFLISVAIVYAIANGFSDSLPSSEYDSYY